MRAGVLSVQWHDQKPVYSLSFHPAGLLATAGGDKEVNVSGWSRDLSTAGPLCDGRPDLTLRWCRSGR